MSAPFLHPSFLSPRLRRHVSRNLPRQLCLPSLRAHLPSDLTSSGWTPPPRPSNTSHFRRLLGRPYRAFLLVRTYRGCIMLRSESGSPGGRTTRPVSTRSLTQHVRSCYSHGQADVRLAVTHRMPPNRTTPWAGASPRHSQLRLRTVRSLRPHRYPPFPERSSQVMIISTAVTRRPEQPTPKPSLRTRSVHRSMHLFSLAMMTDVPRSPTTHFLRCRPRSMRRGASTCFLPPTQGRRRL
jgi:hypothetical protein